VILGHLALSVQATGFAHYGECHSDACMANKPTEECMTGKTIKKRRKRNGSPATHEVFSATFKKAYILNA
jgi:hypothetical protein